MSNNYREYVPHGITFINSLGRKQHTWDDWRIVPTSRPVILPPSIQRMEQEIPGRDGLLDFSESLDGEIHYNNRVGTLEFYVANRDCWNNVYSSIQNFIHGRQLKIILDDDKDYYYEGMIAVNDWKSNQSNSTIVIEYKLQPYKLKHEKTTVIAKIDGEAVVVCQNERRSYVPTIISDAEMNLVFNDSSYSIGAGTYILPDMKFIQGDNIITCTGTGTITFTYQEGAL